MREKEVEKYLIQQVRKELGGIAYKFTSPGRRSVPDRLCVVQKEVFFVECKATGKAATYAQLREHDRLRDLDHWVYVVSSKYAINRLIKFWRERINER